ncbi:MAG: PD40 domain-containing protein [Bacteroidales bacterium]|nr:PD40 domain-containing protein [Bacteroidales bacterium]
MKQALFLFMIIASTLAVKAQVTEEVLKEYFLDAEFFLAQEEYIDALYDYTELYNNGFKDNANINYRIGVCYLNIPGMKDKSIPYLLEAVKNIKNNNRDSKYKEEKAPMDAYLFLGNAYRVNNMLDKAIEAYNTYRKFLPASDKNDIAFADIQIAACNAAKEFMANPVTLEKTNLGEVINTTSSNFKAVISGDGKTLLYMNELPFYDAVYYSVLKNGQWSNPVNITPMIQSDGDQYVTSVSYDGTVLYLTREDNFNSDIYVSRLVESIWQKSVPLNKLINTKFWESHASISKDGKVLYFASNRQEGYGGMDIYKSELDASGDWGTPVNLGAAINTALNEDNPFITEDGKTLFFSSQGHKGLGGYDIFKAVADVNSNWGYPVNLGYPLNTTDDDLFYYPYKNGKYGYISLLEPDGLGKEDIYKVQIIVPGVAETEEVVEEEKPEVAQVTEETGETPVVEETTASTEQETTGEAVQDLVAEEMQPEETVTVEAAKEEVLLTPVYFAFDSYALTEKGKTELDQIVSLAKKYPGLTFELIGLTDAIGSAEYNKTLSVKRANAARNYLVAAGVSAGKLVAIGYGETRFAAINSNPDGSDNPEGRRYNRRVEIEIKGNDASKLLIKKSEVPENLQIK